MRSTILASATIGALASLVLSVAARGDEAPAVPDDAGDMADAADPLASSDADSDASDANDASDAATPDTSVPLTFTDAATSTPQNTGFAFGLRAGVSLPVGRVSSRPIRDVIVSSLPFTVDLGYFIDPHLYVGLYGGMAFVTSSSADTTTCPARADCTAKRWRVGAMAAWHFRPLALVDPHVGLGVAYDLVNLTASDSVTGDVVESSALQGLEFLDLHMGIDIRPKPFWGFGPTIDGSMGTYASGWNVHSWLGGGLHLFSVL